MDIIREHLRGVSGYNSKGEEIPDPRPKELKIDVEAEMPIEVKVMRALRSEEWIKRMAAQGRETYEEANDFAVADDFEDMSSIHEDDSGDMLAYEEGVRRGFIEEIPEDRKEKARETAKLIRSYARGDTSGGKKGEAVSGLSKSEPEIKGEPK